MSKMLFLKLFQINRKVVSFNFHSSFNLYRNSLIKALIIHINKKIIQSNLNILSTMEINPSKLISVFAQIRGKNFHGCITKKGDTLSLDITQFKKGDIYISQITNLILKKQFRRFLIFKTVDEIFDEIKQNKRLQVSDENSLILPVEIIYKSKVIQLKIQILLTQRKFSNEAQKMQKLFQQIEKISQAKQKLKEERQKGSILSSQMIFFKGDETNKNYDSFEVSNNGKTVKMVRIDNYTIFNHVNPLPKQGIYFFKCKIIKTKSKQIMFGVCSSNIKQKKNKEAFQSLQFMGFYLVNGFLYKNGSYVKVAQGLKIAEGQIVKVQIDMNKNTISWLFQKEGKFYETEIAEQLKNGKIHPIIFLYHQGDTIELLYQ